MKPLAALLILSLLPLVSRSQTPAPARESTTVAHGTLHHEAFASKFIKAAEGDQGKYVVYTPPNYDPSRKPGYPVLYLMHGWGGDEDAWTRSGKADIVLDGMIASGKAQSMIVVMPLGYGNMNFLTNGFDVWRDQAQISDNVNRFESALLQEIVPQVEGHYAIVADREHRAIAGLSMGGLEALTIGLRHPDLFAWIGGFSSAIFPVAGADLTKLDAKKKDLRLLWVACGTGDDLLSINRIFEMHLREQGLPVTAIETPGRHEWPVWRDNFRHFAPLLFQPRATLLTQAP